MPICLLFKCLSSIVMATGKDTLQRKDAQGSGQLEGDSEIKRSASPPAQLFADAGAGTNEAGGGGDAMGINTTADLMKRVGDVVGKGAAEAAQKGAANATAGAESVTADPPNKFVAVNDRTTNKISDAVVTPLNAAIDEVKNLTGVDIGTGFGDTTRGLGAGTQKVGADNFSWHKSGRAVDFNQALKWVIAKNPSGGDMYFRIYLEANEAGAASAYAKTFTDEEKKTLHSNGMGASVTKKPVVDVTAILDKNGFERIPAHDGWEKSYNKQEWWHYVKDDGLTWYAALRQIYTDDQIVTAMKKLVVDRHVNGGRLGRREGFPAETLKAIWNNVAITKGKLSLFFSVGSNANCANIPEDVAAVKAALIGLGIAESADVSTMISAFQVKNGSAKGDGYMSVGGGTHGKIGAQMK